MALRLTLGKEKEVGRAWIPWAPWSWHTDLGVYRLLNYDMRINRAGVILLGIALSSHQSVIITTVRRDMPANI